MRSPHHFQALAWFVCVATATPALGAERLVTLVRGSGSGSDRAAGLVGHYARQAFLGDDRYEVVDLVRTLGSPGRDRAERAFNLADNLLEKGREAYLTLELDQALEFLNNAVAKYERHAAYVESFVPYVEALMLLGATRLLRGEDRLGERRFREALTLNPEVDPQPFGFNPDMRAVFERAARRGTTRTVGSLNIASTPNHGQVFVNGALVGITPVDVTELAEGRHFVQVRKDGLRPWGRIVEVKATSVVGVKASLKATTHFDDFDALVDKALAALATGRVSEAVDQLGVLLNADQVFLADVRVDDDDVVVQAVQYNLNRQIQVKKAQRRWAYDAPLEAYAKQVTELHRRYFGRRTLDRPMDSEASVSEMGRDSPPLKQWLVWGGIGGGAVLMGTGALLWVFADEDNAAFRDSVQVSGAADDLESSGRAKAVTGDILFFVGAAAAITGAALQFFWHPTADEERSGDSDDELSVTFTPLPAGAAVGATLRF